MRNTGAGHLQRLRIRALHELQLRAFEGQTLAEVMDECREDLEVPGADVELLGALYEVAG